MATERLQVLRFTEIEKMFLQVDYSIQDIKSAQVTTDTYINDYLPVKIEKNFNKLMQRVYEDSACESDVKKTLLLRRIEEEQQKQMYYKMLTDDNKKQPKPQFKQQLA